MKLPQTLFMLTAVATTVFVITILAMVAMLLGDPDAPVNLWFNRQGATVMTFEVLAIGAFGMSAILFDRREIQRELRQQGLSKNAGERTRPPESTQSPPKS